MARRKTGLVGASRVRKILKALPDGAAAEIIKLYRIEGPAIASYMRSRTPTKTGFGRSQIKHRIGEKSLVLRVGLVGNSINGLGARFSGNKRSAFYLRILERGRGNRGRTTRSFSRRTPSGGRSKVFTARIKPIARGRYDFVEGVVARAVFARLRPKLGEIWKRAIANLKGISG